MGADRWTDKWTLSNLPVEIISLIASHLDVPSVNSLVQTAHQFNELLSPSLYKLGAFHVSGGSSPLIWAVRNRQLPVLTRLLQAGADPSQVVNNRITQTWDSTDDNPIWEQRSVATTALHESVIHNNYEALLQLLGAGAAHGRDGDGHRPIMLAALRDRTAMLRALMDFGAIDRYEYGTVWFWTLELTVDNGNQEATRLLLEAADKAQSLPQDDSLQQLVFNAATDGDCDMIRLLFEFGANVWKDADSSYTPLHAAVWNGNADAVRLLLAEGLQANCESSDRHGTPLHIAANQGSLDVVMLLLGAGADIHAVNLEGDTPLLYGLSLAPPDVISALLDGGADIRIRDRDGYTVLHRAIRSVRGEDVLQVLLDAGAEVNATDRAGNTALHLTAADTLQGNSLRLASHEDAAREMWKMIPVLVAAGADVKSVNRLGQTALHIVASRGVREALKLLIDSGADIDARDDEQLTSLHNAVLNQSLTNATYLLHRGANPYALDLHGRSPLDWASSNRKILSKLLDHCEYRPTNPAERNAVLRKSVVTLANSVLAGDNAYLGLYKIGKCLQYLEDIPGARRAYSIGWDASCKGCKRDIPASEGRLVCCVCDEIDLCHACTTPYKEGSLRFMFCYGHDFLELEWEGYVPLSDRAGVLEEEEKVWLRSLVAEYSKPPVFSPRFLTTITGHCDGPFV